MSDAAAFIRKNLRLEPVSGLPGITLYQAHPGSRLSRLAIDDDAPAPYWAYPWAGGLALAHHFLAAPDIVRSKRVLDLGAGSGLVAIAAVQAGATAFASEIDSYGQSAIALNAAANSVTVEWIELSLAGDPPEGIDVIAAGDVFYSAHVAALMLPFLERCAGAGLSVFVGDLNRRDLPVEHLTEIASYPVWDLGDPPTSLARVGRVYSLGAIPATATVSSRT